MTTAPSISNQQISAVQQNLYCATQSIFGSPDVRLAGMPNGNQTSNADTAPAHSPILAGIQFATGYGISFTTISEAMKFTQTDSDTCPESGRIDAYRTKRANGIADVASPVHAVMGVFLGTMDGAGWQHNMDLISLTVCKT